MIGPNLTFAAQSEDLLSQRHPLILTQLLADILTTLIFENVLPFCCRFCFLCFPCRVWCEGKSPKEVTVEDAAMNVRFLFTSSETKRKKNRFYIFFRQKNSENSSGLCGAWAFLLRIIGAIVIFVQWRRQQCQDWLRSFQSFRRRLRLQIQISRKTADGVVGTVMYLLA